MLRIFQVTNFIDGGVLMTLDKDKRDPINKELDDKIIIEEDIIGEEDLEVVISEEETSEIGRAHV